jgi:hypothetical protein
VNAQVSFSTRAVPVALLGVIGCAADTKLDDALRQYVEQRRAEAEAGCECYYLFLDFNSPDNSMFTSKQECLEATLPVSEIDAVGCMRTVLEDSGVGTDESIDIVNCYTQQTAHTTDCYLQNAELCSASACSSDIATDDTCNGRLTPLQASTLHSCV